jgi:hypothetical protein
MAGVPAAGLTGIKGTDAMKSFPLCTAISLLFLCASSSDTKEPLIRVQIISTLNRFRPFASA